MPRRILHPTDFSSASRAAFARAVTEARAARAQLLVVHVLSPVVPLVGEGYVAPAVYQQMSDAARTWAQKQLARLVARAKAARVRARGLLREGVVADQIVRVARAQRADLIVIGTHGRTGVARFFLGSVVDRVSEHAHCSVLIVR